ncbi:TPA: hypothetical protein R8F97_000992 [Pseudomonas putida]|nr:hypothetical protein [Pseudomonas putida]
MDAMMLWLYSIPEIKLNTGTDWLALAGVILTGAIVAIGAWTTIKNFKATTDSQERIAERNAAENLEHSKAQNVAKNRQEWINSLRLAISEFIAACYEIRALKKISQKNYKLEPACFEDEMDLERHELEIQSKLVRAEGEAKKQLALVELYINPGEHDSRELVRMAHIFLESAGDQNFKMSWEADELIKVAQEILKTEWERVKKMV